MSPRAKEAAWLAAILVPWLALLAPTLASPPVGRESWREADGLAVARNYCRERAPFFEPRVDARRDGPGITGMEFPLLNWLEGAALCRGLPLEATGRTLGLAFALLGVLAFWALLRDACGPRVALFGAALYAYSPLVFYYGRATMPDVPALSLGIASLWLLRRGLAQPGARRWVLIGGAFVFLALAALLKLPFALLGLPAAWSVLATPSERRLPRLLTWAAAGVATLVPALLWYRFALGQEERYDTHVFLNNMRRPVSEMLFDLRSPAFYKLLLVQHPFDVWVFPGTTVLALLAFALSFRRLPGWLWAWAAGAALFFLAGGYPTVHHIYYGLPAVPVLCAAAAIEGTRCAERWKVPWAAALFAAVGGAYCVMRTHHLFPRRDVAAAYIEAKQTLDAARPKGESVTVFSGGSPLIFWMLDRQGWYGDPVWVDEGRMPTKIACVDRSHPDAPDATKLEAALSLHGCASLHASHELSVWTCP